jgi:hypothetical protein
MDPREELVYKVEELVSNWPTGGSYQVAEAILDAILPQITTVEELDTLPNETVLVGADGYAFRLEDGVLFAEDGAWHPPNALRESGPLTVVWRPS